VGDWLAALLPSVIIEPSYALRLIEDRPEGVGYLLKERVSTSRSSPMR
jgi:hypothetical protein